MSVSTSPSPSSLRPLLLLLLPLLGLAVIQTDQADPSFLFSSRRQAPSATAIGGDDFFNSYFDNAIAGLPTDSAASPEGAEAS